MLEKQLFDRLLKTSGIGPKLGVAILSNLTPSKLIRSIQQEDITTLSSVPGIGKKTATKLCLDMKDTLKKHPIQGLKLEDESQPLSAFNSTSEEDLLSALVNMGFAEKNVLPILSQIQSTESTFERQIKKALKLLVTAN